MSGWKKVTVIVIGILLLLTGILNIIDDVRMRTYDLAALLSGLGFLVVSAMDRNKEA